MPTFKKCPTAVHEVANELLAEFATHKLVVERQVKIDYLFAFPDYDDESGEPTNDALKWNGVKALGITRIVNLKDRTKGMGDVEICLDGNWWEDADDKERRALLDHELHHIIVTVKNDDLGRPKIKMRKHDIQVGWFAIIAQRHGIHSQEQKQAASIMLIQGQFFWPAIAEQIATGTRASKLEVRK